MPYCSHCGVEYEAVDQFCGNCGEKLSRKSGPPNEYTESPTKDEIRTNQSQNDPAFEPSRRGPLDTQPGLVRKVAGSIAGLVIAFGLLLISRQINLFFTTRDGYYLVSTGLFLLIMSILWAGVAWGFFTGERAEGIFGAPIGIVILGCFVAALYYWITGLVLRGNVDDIFSALVWTITGVSISFVSIIISKIVVPTTSTGE
jgi:hypothetical protein